MQSRNVLVVDAPASQIHGRRPPAPVVQRRERDTKSNAMIQVAVTGVV